MVNPTNSSFTFSTDSEIRQLQEFVLELREILQDVVNHPRPAIAGRHHKRLNAAWEDAMQGSNQGNDIFSAIARDLGGTPTEPQPNVRGKLESVGLTGAPLALKLGTYQHARDEYFDLGKAEQIQAEPKSEWQSWRKLLGRVLQTSGVILGSTASQIPGGEYLKEFVEEIHLLTELTGDLKEIS